MVVTVSDRADQLYDFYELTRAWTESQVTWQKADSGQDWASNGADSMTLAIAHKELKGYFASPIAYIVLGFFALMFGFFFYSLLLFFDRGVEGATPRTDTSTMVLTSVSGSSWAIRPTTSAFSRPSSRGAA